MSSIASAFRAATGTQTAGDFHDAARRTYDAIMNGRVSGDTAHWIGYWATAVESARHGNIYALSVAIENFVAERRIRESERQGGLVVLSAMLHAAANGHGFASGSAVHAITTASPMHGFGNYTSD